ncbi:MAG TPA: zinc-dependent alcohol dehydrogenase family protein [Steroidobacteraceae bacterium]|jgi:NADPH:quinone reductase-like Zn-dependent oxidoreductase|nr:zinc-dependent alcohol dehydrogenase family protein [Steroidobacteraceae bacterium]
MSKVVRFHRLGGPETLQVDEVQVGAPKAGEVRIKVAAIGLNRVEAMFRSGAFGAPTLPARIGYEAAGIIEAVGDGVHDFKAGEHVATMPGLPMETHGTYAEEILYPANMLIRQPAGLPLEAAAAAWMQYLTAYALIGITQLKSSDTVVITAASSSVGLAAIQIANSIGARSIAVTRGQSKVEALTAHGASHVVATDQENPTEAVMRLTGGQGARIIFDAVAGKLLGQLAMATAPGGWVIVYGSLAGDTMPVSLPAFMMKGLTLRGYAMNDFMRDESHRQRAIDFIGKGLSSGTLKPVIDRVFPLSEIAAAHRYLEGNTQIGKIIVRPDASR